ncbi:MAG: alpha/beta hydrolase [Verrucomicrobia bacterium]|nr:alpha/beta hydrolase [Verrucomicrobiota bacterium]
MVRTALDPKGNTTISPETFVLVHGAWHGGWCWRRVVHALRASGHAVFTPTLTGLGERIHLLRPGLTIEHFATDVANVMEAEELRDVILVGHSFGGGPISVVADRRPELLKRLVYLDATLLENGQSAFSKLEPAVVAQRVKLAHESSGGLTIPPPAPATFGVTDPNDDAWLQRRLTPHPLHSYQEPIRLNHPLGNGIKKTYIACTRPLYEPLLSTHEWVRQQKGWQYLEFAGSHDAMVGCPDAVAELLASCA